MKKERRGAVRQWQTQALPSQPHKQGGKAHYYAADRLKRDEYIATVGMYPERAMMTGERSDDFATE